MPCFSHDGKKLASAGDDSLTVIWSAQTGARLEALKGSKEWLCAVAFDVTDRKVAVGGDDKMVTVWKLKSK